MMMGIGEHADLRRALKPLCLNVPTLLLQNSMTRGSKRRRVRHLAPCDKGIAGIRR
jgi:hypothetical protein